jgi:hypothetical protein
VATFESGYGSALTAKVAQHGRESGIELHLLRGSGAGQFPFSRCFSLRLLGLFVAKIKKFAAI